MELIWLQNIFVFVQLKQKSRQQKNVLNGEGTAAFNCFAAICTMCVLRTEGWTRKRQSYSVFSR